MSALAFDLPSTVPASPDGNGRPGPSLPFDPLRLVSALLKRWHAVVGAGVILGVFGGLVGRSQFVSQYKATSQLMREESSATFRASELGEPFKPRELSVPTLVSFMKSPAVLQRVAETAQLSVRSIAKGLTITPERNTDLISLTFASTGGAQMAVRALNAFGKEVVRLTREMQAQEAAEVNRVLSRQLTRAEEDLRAVNSELLDFSREAGLINADKEIDAYLRSLGDLDLRFETMRIDYETLDLKIHALERELAANNPLGERIQVAKERLSQLLQQYTEANPLVEEQKVVVAELETRWKEAENKPLAPPRQGESGLAVSFYADLLSLKTQKQVTAVQIEKLTAVRAGVEARLRGLPEKGMRLARIRARQQSLEAAQSLLASRQREAQLYEENPLGYYRYFESKLDEVEVAGRGKKVVLLSIGGGVFGAFFAVAGICLIESLDDRIKTSADLKRVTRLPLLATLPELDTLDAVAQLNWALRTWLALQARLSVGTRRQKVCGFLSSTGHEGCSTWVELIGRAASQREESIFVVTNRPNVGGHSIPLEEALAQPELLLQGRLTTRWLVAPADWRWTAERRNQWRAAREVWEGREGVVILVELTSADQPETLQLAEQFPQLIWLARSGSARAAGTVERLETFRNAGCRFIGAVLNRESKLLPW